MDEWISLQSLGFSKYEAHRSGNIRNSKTKRVLKRKEQESGYVKISISHDNGSYKNIRADRLICQLFIGPPPSQFHKVIHINGNISDSHIDNLKWGDIEEKCHMDKEKFRDIEYINTLTLSNEQWMDCTPYGYIDYLASSNFFVTQKKLFLLKQK